MAIVHRLHSIIFIEHRAYRCGITCDIGNALVERIDFLVAVLDERLEVYRHGDRLWGIGVEDLPCPHRILFEIHGHAMLTGKKP